MKVNEDRGVSKVWLVNKGVGKAFKQVVKQLKVGKSEGWVGKKVDDVGGDEVHMAKTEFKIDTCVYTVVKIKNEPAEVKETSIAIE